MDAPILIIVIIALFVGTLLLILLLSFGMTPLTRWWVRRTGEPAQAVILDCQTRKGAMYSGESQLVAQNITLKVEVHPTSGTIYPAEDRFMARAMDLMKLRPGCHLEVRIDRRRPNRVVCLPETVTAPAEAPLDARANLAIAELIASGHTSPEDVRRAFETHGVRTQPVPSVENPQARLQKLQDMRIAGLITQQEYDAKKAEILSHL